MAARFKLDENLPREAQVLLLDAGHDAHSVHDERLVGHADAKIFDVCLNEDRVLVTLDLDFADIRQYPPSSHGGVWVLRPETQSIENTLSVLRGAWPWSVMSRQLTAFGSRSLAAFVSASKGMRFCRRDSRHSSMPKPTRSKSRNPKIETLTSCSG